MADDRPRTVGDYVTLQRGTTYAGSLVGEPGPALLGLGSIEPGGGFRHDYQTYGGDCPANLMCFPGDLYAALKGATKDGKMIGSVARVPTSVSSGRLTQDTVKLVFSNSYPDQASYLYWILRTPQYRAYCAGHAMGSAVVALSRVDFLNYPVPPLTPLRQQLITIFDAIEKKIDLNRRVSESLESIARALFKAWFIDFEPVRAKIDGRWKPGQSLPGLPAQLYPMFPNSFEQTGSTQIPAGWQTVALESLVEGERGISYGIVQPGARVLDGIPIIRVSDIRNARINTQNPLRVAASVEGAYTRTRLKGGELLLTLVGTVGETAVVPQDLAGWNTARAVAVLPIRKHVGAHWVRLALNSPTIRQIIDSRLNTTVQATLNLGDVSQLPITTPPDIQGDKNSVQQFNNLLAPVFESLSIRDQESRTVAFLRDCLLPRLISGEIPLRKALPLLEGVL